MLLGAGKGFLIGLQLDIDDLLSTLLLSSPSAGLIPFSDPSSFSSSDSERWNSPTLGELLETMAISGLSSMLNYEGVMGFSGVFGSLPFVRFFSSF